MDYETLAYTARPEGQAAELVGGRLPRPALTAWVPVTDTDGREEIWVFMTIFAAASNMRRFAKDTLPRIGSLKALIELDLRQGGILLRRYAVYRGPLNVEALIEKGVETEFKAVGAYPELYPDACSRGALAAYWRVCHEKTRQGMARLNRRQRSVARALRLSEDAARPPTRSGGLEV
jgi:hypothetical protein